MTDENHIRADEDIVPHLRLEKRLLTWRAADEIERLTAERDAAVERAEANGVAAKVRQTHIDDLQKMLDAAEAERDALRELLRDRMRFSDEEIDAALNKGGGDE